MLESFWASLEIDDVSDLGYTENTPYKTQEQIKDINIYYVLLMYSLVKYGLTL